MEESDFIKCPKHQNSLAHYLSNNDNIHDSVIARLLMISEEEVEKIYKESIDILRKSMVGSKKGE
jgi:hypothetical protein